MDKNNKAKYVFEISYDTSETKDHTIDAEKLGAAIIGTAKALKNADKTLNGEESDLDLDVKAHSEGSFVVEFVTYLNANGINPLTLLGFAGGATVASKTVLGAIAEIKSRTIKLTEKTASGKTKLYFNDEDSLELDDDIAKLVLNRDIRKDLDTVIKAPLQGTTDAKFKIKDQDGNEVVFDSEEVQSFKTPSKTIVDEISESEETKDIRFVKINFEGSSGWQVRLPDGDVLTVKMSDDRFLTRIKGNEQNFVKDDLFSVVIKTTKKHRTGNSPIYNSEITRVVRHRVRPEAKIIKDNE
ncbi:hypothetical protein [Pseudoalteromonas sp. T1lg21]|uniref:hypothetical protein n=1 Tax=Pseudoalteromonas sp. T1lg21 TaxID=2077095 RepID=UPI000CF6416F|nr:hypothetical protein [Pseudoalteromonas sp. T1lg21]